MDDILLITPSVGELQRFVRIAVEDLVTVHDRLGCHSTEYESALAKFSRVWTHLCGIRKPEEFVVLAEAV